MVKKQDENQADGGQNAEKNQTVQQKPDQQGRARVNNQSFNQNPRSQNQFRQQGGAQTDASKVTVHKEGQVNNQGQPGHNQFQPRNNNVMRNQTERQEGFVRESAPNRHFRDRNRDKDGERDNQQRPFSNAAGGRFSSISRSRAEETIDDIKEDIIRLEKEIDLEIKEIRSLKL